MSEIKATENFYDYGIRQVCQVSHFGLEKNCLTGARNTRNWTRKLQCSVEPLNKDTFGTSRIVLSREVVLFQSQSVYTRVLSTWEVCPLSECPLSEVLLCNCTIAISRNCLHTSLVIRQSPSFSGYLPPFQT